MNLKRFISQKGYFNVVNIPEDLKPVESEVRLARKVLDRALLDLFEDREVLRQDAFDWFFGEDLDKDFETICEIAFYPPNKVRKKVKNIVDKDIL